MKVEQEHRGIGPLGFFHSE